MTITDVAIRGQCTGCRACAAICPQNCISYDNSDTGEIIPRVNLEACISCGLCNKVCPIKHDICFREPQLCYAAQETNQENVRRSASGGYVGAAYHMVLEQDGWIVGVGGRKENFQYIVTQNKEMLELFRNSKYVQSDPSRAYQEIEKRLKSGSKVFFVGLPCHVAGVLDFCECKNVPTEHLVTCDIVCHGVIPKLHLENYIAHYSQSLNTEISFRDPEYGTMRFVLSLFDENGKRIRHKAVRQGDVYQYSYHRGVAYQESCYECRYACWKRISDITVSDFPGYKGHMEGKKTCVLINSEKGKQFHRNLVECGRLHCEERDFQEAAVNRQMHNPFPKSSFRKAYLERLLDGMPFFEAAEKTLRSELRKDVISYYPNQWNIKIRNAIPIQLKEKLRKYIKKIC